MVKATRIRADRLLSLYFFSPLAGIADGGAGFRIPILMYHSVSAENEYRVHPYYRISTAPEVFRNHILFLRENGYSVISLGEAVDMLAANSGQSKQISRRPVSKGPHSRVVALTFDDGYKDFLTAGFPVLKKYGFTATVFLPTAFIDTATPGLKGKKHLSWSDVKMLQADGIAFGSHTVNHSYMKQCSFKTLEYEIIESKKSIEDRTGRAVEFFSYPYRFPEQDSNFTGFLTERLRLAGYRGCMTTRIGRAASSDPVFALPRLPVNSSDDARLLKAKLQGGYDWLGRVQMIKKKIEVAPASLADSFNAIIGILQLRKKPLVHS